MKKIIFAAFFMLFSIAFTTLSAQGSTVVVKDTQQKEVTVSATDFDVTFEAFTASLGAKQSLLVSVSDGNYIFSIIDDGGGIDHVEKVRCEGGGMKFARCAKEAIDKYGCQKVSKVSEDNYKSEDC